MTWSTDISSRRFCSIFSETESSVLLVHAFLYFRDLVNGFLFILKLEMAHIEVKFHRPLLLYFFLDLFVSSFAWTRVHISVILHRLFIQMLP